MSESDEPGPVCWQSHKELGFKYNKIYSDYEKLLAKYNYLLEWSHKQGDLGYRELDFYRRAFERAYKGSLK